jgi:hypothetical protein
MGRFEMFCDWPDELLPVAKELLAEVEWLLPPWCLRAIVTWDAGEDAGALRCSIDAEYRKFRLTFSPRFFDEDAATRRRHVMHELIHCHNLLIYDYARKQIRRLLPKDDAPKYQETVLEGLVEKMEQSTEDLTYCLTKKLDELNGAS